MDLRIRARADTRLAGRQEEQDKLKSPRRPTHGQGEIEKERNSRRVKGKFSGRYSSRKIYCSIMGVTPVVVLVSKGETIRIILAVDR